VRRSCWIGGVARRVGVVILAGGLRRRRRLLLRLLAGRVHEDHPLVVGVVLVRVLLRALLVLLFII